MKQLGDILMLTECSHIVNLEVLHSISWSTKEHCTQVLNHAKVANPKYAFCSDRNYQSGLCSPYQVSCKKPHLHSLYFVWNLPMKREMGLHNGLVFQESKRLCARIS